MKILRQTRNEPQCSARTRTGCSPWQVPSRPDSTVSASTQPFVSMTLIEVLTLSDYNRTQETSLDGHRHLPDGRESLPSVNSTQGAECKN